MLMPFEYRSLKKYLSDGHHNINRVLRKPELMDDAITKQVAEINTTLDNIISFDNSVVYHSGFISGVPVETLWIYFKKRIGENIKIPNFLSTTKDPDILFKNQPKVFKIYTAATSNAKDITTLDFKKLNEGEVLFKNGTFFKILGSQPDLITLEELSEPPLEFEILGEDYFMNDEEIRELINSGKENIQSLSDQNLI
jgi:hypothetical protein